MRLRPRALAAIAVTGILVALIAVQLRRGDATAEGGLPQPTGDGVITTSAAKPGGGSAPGPPAAPAGGMGNGTLERCERLVDEARAFALAESDAAFAREGSDPDQDGLYAELHSLQRSLAGTGDPAHMVAALLLDLGDAQTVDDRSTHTTLQELGGRATGSGSPLLAWHALRVCVQARERCPFTHLEQRLLDTQRQNADAWVLVAMLRHQRGDTGGALAAMQGAGRAQTSTWYWTETIAAIERSLAAHTAIPYPDRLDIAAGSAAAHLPLLPHRMCKAESAANRAWAQACLAYGTLSASRNETNLARSIALIISEEALSALGDTERAAQVAAARAPGVSGADRVQRAVLQGKLHDAVLASDPAHLAFYLDAVRQHGESAGMSLLLQKEVPVLMQRAGLLQDDGARECVALVLEPHMTPGVVPGQAAP